MLINPNPKAENRIAGRFDLSHRENLQVKIRRVSDTTTTFPLCSLISQQQPTKALGTATILTIAILVSFISLRLPFHTQTKQYTR